jgi:phospholipid/cholesterol/gamma-HCH transport system substrate-binding protein
MDKREQRSRVHYIHHLSYSFRERLVGVFVLFALALVIGLILAKGQSSHLFEDRVSYNAFLNNAQGISTESIVKISGIDVGKVSSIDITDDNRIHVQFFVYRGFRNLLRVDSRGALNKLSLVGNATLMINAGSAEQPLLPEGATVPVEEPMTADELMAELTPVLERAKRAFRDISEIIEAVDAKQLKSTTADLAATMANLREVSTQLATGQGALGKALYDRTLEQGLTRSVASLEDAMGEAAQRMKELRPMIGSMTALSSEAKQHTEALGDLVDDSRQLITEMTGAVHTVNTEVQQMPELVNRMQLLLESTDHTLEGVQRLWPLSSAIRPGTQEMLIEERPVSE